MSTETTPNGATATTTDRSTELVNKLLKLPEQTRIDLAHLLLDSVREGFTSLEEAEKRDKELIRKRIEEVVSGKAELLDPEQVFAAMRKRIEEVRKA
jgi:flagellar motor component MotA